MRNKGSLTLLIFVFINLGIYAQVNFNWAKSIGGGNQDEATSIAIDSLGNVYTAGIFSALADFDPGVGTYTLGSYGGYDAFISKLDPSGNFIWAKQIGGLNTEFITSIQIDKTGNIYCTGVFSGITDFDSGPGTFTLSSQAGSNDIYVCKLNSNGDLIWVKQMGGTNSDVANCLTVDNSGNVYSAGYFVGTADFDPGPSTYTFTSAASNLDIFISKLDASGNFVWAKQMGGTASDQVKSIEVDANGNVYTTGIFMGTADFDPGPATYSFSTFGAFDSFISKLNSSGDFIWAKQIGGISNDQSFSMVLDASDNIYYTGFFLYTVDFDPGPGTFTLSSVANTADAFICKLNNQGNFIWAKQIGGKGSDQAFSISLDKFANVYTTGTFIDTVDFDPGVGTFSLSAPTGNAFINKLDSSGSFKRTVRMGGSGFASGNSIVLDDMGNIYTAGYYQLTSDFDPDATHFNLFWMGSHDIYTSKHCQIPAQPNLIMGPSSLCEGSNVTYFVKEGFNGSTYNWTMPSGWTGSSITNSITATVSALSGSVSVIVANACGNSSAQNINVSVNPLPNVLASSNNTLLCSGQSATLSATGALTYTWSTNENTANVVISPSVQTTFTVQGTDSNGCLNLAVITQDVDICNNVPVYSNIKMFSYNVYPNPSTGIYILETQANTVANVIDMLGNIIYSKALTEGKNQINLSEFSDGQYILKLTSNECFRTVKLIKD